MVGHGLTLSLVFVLDLKYRYVLNCPYSLERNILELEPIHLLHKSSQRTMSVKLTLGICWSMAVIIALVTALR
jgi:hypothetical protein